ncbi:NrsF family protein [Thalassospira marina]|uniref:Anti-sigma F factor n=1 Tax=Thalassospira marina TaxID=2048283 RepID=A0A2N3L0D6_9PROT|nr:NrsF family protein [Thalassospira marina]PKR56190.1 hypothetical protein COO20_03090 [Thalassospira marina]
MSTLKTDDLINSLASQAGTANGPSPRKLHSALAGSALAGVIMAVMIILVLVGPRTDLIAMDTAPATFFKVIAMLAAGIAAFKTLRELAIAGGNAPSWLIFVPILVIIAVRIITDQSGGSWLGAAPLAAPICVGTIIVASLPALGLLMYFLRKGATVHPGKTGAFAGMLAGALAAMAYAIACRNDAGLFLLIWYPVAVGIVTALGAAIGRRVLAW